MVAFFNWSFHVIHGFKNTLDIENPELFVHLQTE